MKKVFLLFGVAAFMASTVLVGCKKEEESSPLVPDMSKTATIKGRVEANLNSVNDTAIGFYNTGLIFTRYENVPEGTMLTFKIQAKSFPGSNAADNIYLKYSTKVNANGEYEINLPVTNQGVDVDIEFNDFTYDKVNSKWKFSITTNTWSITSDGTERKIYKCGNSSVTDLSTGKIEIIDFKYN